MDVKKADFEDEILQKLGLPNMSRFKQQNFYRENLKQLVWCAKMKNDKHSNNDVVKQMCGFWKKGWSEDNVFNVPYSVNHHLSNYLLEADPNTKTLDLNERCVLQNNITEFIQTMENLK